MLENDLLFVQQERDNYKELSEHWKEMYINLLKRYEEAVKDYDNLVMETMKRDLNND